MNELIDVRERWVLHFTHLNNLAGIRERGALVCDAKVHGQGLVTEVGARDIKAGRRHRPVPVGPRGVVGDYVPFYFAPRSPMLYRIACECRDATPERYQGGDRPLVYLAATVGAVVDAARPWVATDGNAASAVTTFVDDLPHLAAAVDWPLMQERYWGDTPEDRDRQRRRMAELLVHEFLPLTAVHQVTAYSEGHARRARSALGNHALARRVAVLPDWYYGFERR